MVELKVGDIAMVIKRFKVFRVFPDTLDMCDDNGNCITVSKKIAFFEDYKLEHFMKAMKQAVLETAKSLLKANNKVTTLEIKLELRRDYPYYYWDQETVSSYMAQFAGDGIFNYTDNGTYREYSLANAFVNTGLASKTVSNKPATTTGALQPTGIRHSFGKVAGTVPSQPNTSKSKAVAHKRGRGRPRKVTNSNLLTKAQAYNLAGTPSFENVKVNGAIVTWAQIRKWKKSPQGYLTPSKLDKTTEITWAGTTYQVK